MEMHLFRRDRQQFERASSLRPGRHAALQLFKPVQHDIDLRWGRLLLAGLEHQEALAVR
jgi:hypothetical protein